METEYEIREEILKLNHKWFSERLKKFQTHKNFDSESDKIKIFVKAGYQDENGEMIDDSWPEIIDLNTFCECYLPLDESNNFGLFPFEPLEEQESNFKEVSDRISKIVKKSLEEVRELRTKELAVHHFRNFIFEEVKKLKVEGDHKYSLALEHFYSLCSQGLSSTFENVEFFSSLERKTDYLKFDLQQEELVALIWIINEAGLFASKDERPKYFLEFAYQHFKFSKKGKYQSPTSLRILEEKFNEIIRDTAGNGFSKVKQKLQRVLQLRD